MSTTSTRPTAPAAVPRPPAGHRIPDYLEAVAEFTYDDFVKDALGRGYSKGQAHYFALKYLVALGRLQLTAPEIAWADRAPSLKLRTRDGRVAWLASKGNLFRLYDSRGRMIQSEDYLASAVWRASDAGWVSP